MYAIVKTGGKQYRAEAGRTIEVERLPFGEGDTVELGEVLMIADDGNVTIGTPLIEGARVLAHVESNGRATKIIVFKYKSKTRYRKKTGHRQNFTRLTVEQILRPGEGPQVVVRKPPKVEAAKAEVAEAIVAQGAEATAPVAMEAAEVKAPKGRARRAKPEAEKKPAASKAKAEKPEAKAKKPAAPKAKAEKPEAKAKKPAKAEKPTTVEAKTDYKPKAPRRRPPISKKKETE